MARGSATECAAHLDALKNRRLISAELYSTCRDLLLRVVGMLSRLTEPLPPPRAT
jgi:hypothetical protein